MKFKKKVELEDDAEMLAFCTKLPRPIAYAVLVRLRDLASKRRKLMRASALTGVHSRRANVINGYEYQISSTLSALDGIYSIEHEKNRITIYCDIDATKIINL